MDKQLYPLLGRRLFDAYESCKPIGAFSLEYPDITIEDAYAIQMELKRCHEAAGRHVIGRKIGLTSKGMRAQANLDQPDYGFLFGEAQFFNGYTVPYGASIIPKVECELVFKLSADLDRRNLSREDVLDATEYICPSIEIVDKRYYNFYGNIYDNVSDNAFFYGYIMGDRIAKPREHNLDEIGLTVFQNGVQVLTGTGAGVMGHPTEGVIWLAGKMLDMGMPLRAGELILSGSFTGGLMAQPGDYFEAVFSDDLGSVRVSFADQTAFPQQTNETGPAGRKE